CSRAGEVAQCVERLIQETNDDLKNFRAEQSQLRAHISNVLDENRNLSNELGKYKQMMGSGDTNDMQQRLNFTSDALSKAMTQIEALQKERRCLQKMQECSERTISHMESELNSYRTQLPAANGDQLTHKYNKAVKILETKLVAQQEEIRTQTDLIKALHAHKQRCGEQIQQLQQKVKDREYDSAARDEDQSKISSLHKQLKELDKALRNSRSLLEQSTKREALAMQKVQESLSICEAAVQEKEEAEKRAEAYKEEAAQLATNIGSIMDEAAKRVDSEVEQLKTKLIEKNKLIVTLREKLKSQIAEHKSAIETLENRNKSVTLKYTETLKQNEKLEAHVEACNKRLTELENSSGDAEHLKSEKNYESQMENYLHAYKKLKAHYKNLLNDLTNKFEVEFYSLHKEKCELQAENDMLRNKAAVDGDGNSA
ncbi:hypothetical protein KR222_007767, partial [Zaprionus bogoriensis]